MKPFAWKFGLCLALAASLAGCSSVPDKQPPAANAYVDSAAPLVAGSEQALDEPPGRIEAYPEPVDPSRDVDSELAAEIGATAVLLGPADRDAVEDSVAPLAGAPVVYDPWQRFNRRMHRFNDAVDRSVARPVAKFYVKVVPEPVRSRVSSFFDNLSQPATAVNALLQGQVKHSA
ncbi:hypothetical protein J2W94_001385 [Pseudoxanthomonas sacheonensis]|uniref:Lipoprotein n=1 Tax=Pseudoxanthomonas sacheonensis TaxID=443615 RepID=A0ABU1RQR5_9GAMM|nr:hypothetical protein [Pseudoxanthomonas sacheonensis]